MNANEITAFLATVRLFRDFDERQLNRLARHFREKTLSNGDQLFTEGEPGGDFYIITSGKIHLARGVGEDKREIGDLARGEFFGEEAYLRNREHSATATALGETNLLVLDTDRFGQLLDDYPNIRTDLEILARSYRLARRKDFSWLLPGEVIHLISQKHYFVFLQALVPSVILGIIGGVLLLSSFLGEGGSLFGNLIVTIPGALVSAIAILWMVWAWIDWGNDYYVVTNKRAIWLEKIVLMYESRHEAPLEAVLSVNNRSDYIQRLWGSADVIISTYTGNIVMANVDKPHQLEDIIREYWQRAQQRASEEEEEMRVQLVRESIGLEEKEELPEREPPPPKPKPGPLLRFANFLKTRHEENGTVTYRKHWFLLLRKSWRVLLFLIITTTLLIVFFGRIPAHLRIIAVGGVFIINFIATGFLIYHIVDWGNDIYQVDHRHIFDIDRKPFGEDSRKSAPLERILNINFRQSFFQQMLNFGTVVINVGEAEFTFDGVVNPSMVQQEVFQRYYARKQSLEARDAERERSRMAEWLRIYHEQVDSGQIIDHEPDM